MILDKFNNEMQSVINPTDISKTIKNFPKTCVAFYSKTLMTKFVDLYNPKKIAELSHSTGISPIYKVKVGKVNIAVYQSYIGAPAAAMQLEEMIALGIKNIVMVGSCGCLDKSIEEYTIIVPTSAIRDEGTSYHYCRATEDDEIKINSKVVKLLESVIYQLGYPHITAKTWTNDAFYRETTDRINHIKALGCKVVDMECSAMCAVSKFRKINFGQLFYAADSIDSEYWDPRNLKNYENSKKFHMIPLAIECARQMYLELPEEQIKTKKGTTKSEIKKNAKKELKK